MYIRDLVLNDWINNHLVPSLITWRACAIAKCHGIKKMFFFSSSFSFSSSFQRDADCSKNGEYGAVTLSTKTPLSSSPQNSLSREELLKFSNHGV